MDMLRLYLPLTWFRGDVLDLPSSRAFLKYNLIFYYLIELFMQLNMIDDVIDAFTDVTLETLLTLLFIYVTLTLNRTLDRFILIASALLVGENLIACFMLPLLAWNTVTESVTSYIFLGLVILWEIIFVSFVFKQILRINRIASFIMGFMYFILTYAGVFMVNALLSM